MANLPHQMPCQVQIRLDFSSRVIDRRPRRIPVLDVVAGGLLAEINEGIVEIRSRFIDKIEQRIQIVDSRGPYPSEDQTTL